MGLESVSVGPGSVNPLRQELKNIDSPLARLVEGMGQDRSLERIVYALNQVGEGFELFNLVEREGDAKEIFEDIKRLTDIDDNKEIKEAAENLRVKIEELS